MPKGADEFKRCEPGPNGEPCTLEHVHEWHGGETYWPLTPYYDRLRAERAQAGKR